MNKIIIPLAILSSLKSNSPLPTSQLLSISCLSLGHDLSKKLLLRILPLLSPQQRSLLQSLY